MTSSQGLRRENKHLAQEIRDLTSQLNEGGRSVMEMQKLVRRLEIEKDELQQVRGAMLKTRHFKAILQALDEAEAALEGEESKVLRAQVEVSQIRQEIEKRIAEKEVHWGVVVAMKRMQHFAGGVRECAQEPPALDRCHASAVGGRDTCQG